MTQTPRSRSALSKRSRTALVWSSDQDPNGACLAHVYIKCRSDPGGKLLNAQGAPGAGEGASGVGLTKCQELRLNENQLLTLPALNAHASHTTRGGCEPGNSRIAVAHGSINVETIGGFWGSGDRSSGTLEKSVNSLMMGTIDALKSITKGQEYSIFKSGQPSVHERKID